MGLLILLLSSRAFSAGPLGDEGTPIDTSAYGIDLYQGAVWSGARLTSLGGSYVAVAYDVDGMLQNAAAPAVRPRYSTDHFDYWLAWGLTLPATLSGMDFFNSGSGKSLSTSPDSLLYMTPGAIVQVGPFGVGVNVEYQSYSLSQEASAGGERAARTTFVQTHLQGAHSFHDGELVVGVGARVLAADVAARAAFAVPESLFAASGVGVEVGVLYQPFGYHFKIGANYRSQVETFVGGVDPDKKGDYTIETPSGLYYLPTHAILPWDFSLGVQYSLGHAEPNLPWRSSRMVMARELAELESARKSMEREFARDLARATNEAAEEDIKDARRRARKAFDRKADTIEREGYRTLQAELARSPRDVAMVTASLVFAGGTSNAVGIESMLEQRVQRSGEVAVVSPRLGSEVEIFPDWVRVRAGTYLEPTRFRDSRPRPHYTGGFDIALGVWDVLGLWPEDYRWLGRFAFDVARDFSTVGFSIGGWYPRHQKDAP